MTQARRGRKRPWLLEPDETDYLPASAYLPVRAQSWIDRPVVAVRPLNDGRWTLLAYSSPDRLTAGCGDDQAWIVVESQRLADLQSVVGFHALLLDVALPEPLRELSDQGWPRPARWPPMPVWW